MYLTIFFTLFCLIRQCFACPEKCGTGSCCKNLYNETSCCPFTNGVCCSDYKHCCPAGTVCDLQDAGCKPLSEYVKVLRNNIDLRLTLNFNICSQKVACLNNQTCCSINHNVWGCCKLPNAVCCGNTSYCCPENYTCYVSKGLCVRMNDKTKLIAKVMAKKSRVELCSQRCYTKSCCTDLSGKLACCPYVDGICCNDSKFCCPKNYTCNKKLKQCVHINNQTGPAIFARFLVDKQLVHVENVCPGGKFHCSNNFTCCPSMNNKWACCPEPNAKCCSDGRHCCPSGTQCNNFRHKCVRTVDAHKNINELSHQSPINTTCQDSAHVCPESESCCPLFDGSAACCPLTKGVCCSDRMHCCPHGSTCELRTKSCVSSVFSTGVGLIDSFKMTKPDPTTNKFAHQRPTLKRTNFSLTLNWCGFCGNLACCASRNASSWMCCQHYDGICCENGLNCCPRSTRCTVDGKCIGLEERIVQRYSTAVLIPSAMKKSKFINFAEKYSLFAGSLKAMPARRNIFLRLKRYNQLKQLRHTICPNSLHYCAASQVCCPSRSHGYTCVPKEATCCSYYLDTYCSHSKICFNGKYCF